MWINEEEEEEEEDTTVRQKKVKKTFKAGRRANARAKRQESISVLEVCLPKICLQYGKEANTRRKEAKGFFKRLRLRMTVW
jgi:hypothetical protein